jgi:hypothetical protein
MADYLEARGYQVRRAQDEGVFDAPGLLVLTPPQGADGAKLDRILEQRRGQGPTLIILPKWIAAPVPAGVSGAKRGWVQLASARSPRWEDFLDDVGVQLAPLGGGSAAWQGGGVAGRLPAPAHFQSGSGARVFPLVTTPKDGRVLAAWLDDGDGYAELRDMAPGSLAQASETADLYPVVLVFEPDLFDNYGMADVANARLAEKLIAAIGANGGRINFDLTLNGHVRSANLLTLAFTPPFLAATLCLLIAALVAGWRAFLRFGPPRRTPRAIAFGKRALVANTAGLIRRTGRRHLIAGPYVLAVRERIGRLLTLPRMGDAAATDAAIDRALAVRAPGAPSFSETAARLAAARRPHDLMAAARDLHALERKLQR